MITAILITACIFTAFGWWLGHRAIDPREHYRIAACSEARAVEKSRRWYARRLEDEYARGVSDGVEILRSDEIGFGVDRAMLRQWRRAKCN
jgi:hypothetical protein